MFSQKLKLGNKTIIFLFKNFNLFWKYVVDYIDDQCVGIFFVVILLILTALLLLLFYKNLIQANQLYCHIYSVLLFFEYIKWLIAKLICDTIGLIIALKFSS